MALAGILKRSQTKQYALGLAQVAIQRYGVSGGARAFSSEGAVIGVDLGTTNSCVAVMEGKEPKVIENSEGFRTIPSVVAFNQEGELLVGTPAKWQAGTNPNNTLFGTKRLIGRKFDDPQTQEAMKMVPYKIVRAPNGDAWVEANGKQYSPSQIGAFVLLKMKETAESYLGRSVANAIITVPAYFNDAQRQATKDAARIAGMEVKRIINEPTAALLSYAKNSNIGLAVVFHLGGGTFDISIIDVSCNVYAVKATNGDTFLGGEDFDNAIFKYLVDEFKKTEGVDLSKDKLAVQRLLEAAEKAKITLSSTTSTYINLPFITGAKHLSIPLTRSKFEKLVSHLIKRIKRSCKDCLKAAGVTPLELDEVLLVGGMTKVPKVRKVVGELFGKEPSKGVTTDEAVVMGAAINGFHRDHLENLVIFDVTPLSLGIETHGGVATKLLAKNVMIPNKKSLLFSTVADGQRQIGIEVLQGERKMVVIGHMVIVDIPPAPGGVHVIGVAFYIDYDGIVLGSAYDKLTGEKLAITFHRSGGLSKADIQNMVEEVEMYAQKDHLRKKFIEGKNLQKNLNKYNDNLQAEIVREIEYAIAHPNKVIEAATIVRTKIEAALVRKEPSGPLYKGIKLFSTQMKVKIKIFLSNLKRKLY